jgi:hypothetical protein
MIEVARMDRRAGKIDADGGERLFVPLARD